MREDSVITLNADLSTKRDRLIAPGERSEPGDTVEMIQSLHERATDFRLLRRL